MLNTFIQQNIFDEAPELIPNRNGYGEGLLEAGKRNEKVVALAADLTESTRTHLFAEAFPERFLQVGIAEQNLASVASGMAALGKIPFIASYAVFSPGRSWEQIRTTIAYNDSNVKIIGAHAGLSVGPDGATHQALEDMAIMRVLPNMIVIAPADVHEARKATLAAAQHEGPVYIRIAREKSEVVTTEDSDFEIGKAYEVFTAPESTVGIITTGTLLYNSLTVAKELTDAGTPTSVLHCPTIKPLDEEVVRTFSERHDVLVTVEEHQMAGGLGSVIAEFTSAHSPKRLLRCGVSDQFGQSGTATELYQHYELDVKGIKSKIESFLN